MQQRLTDPWTRTALVTSEVKNVKLINWAGFCALYGVVSEWKPVTALMGFLHPPKV